MGKMPVPEHSLPSPQKYSIIIDLCYIYDHVEVSRSLFKRIIYRPGKNYFNDYFSDYFNEGFC